MSEILMQQHRAVFELFARIRESEPEHRKPLVDELALSLVAHSVIEKEVLYPACLEELGSDEQLLKAFEEHGLVETCLQKVLTVSPDEETFDAKLEVLEELVAHHVEAEEVELLPEVDAAFTRERGAELARRMRDRYADCVEEGWDGILAEAVAEYMAPTTTRTGTAPPHRGPTGVRLVR